MRSPRRLFLAAVLALLVAATFQSGGIFVFFGVKPNFILVLFAVFSLFVPRFFPYAVLALLGTFFVSFAPGFSKEGAVLLFIASLFFYIRNRFIAPGLLASVIFALLGTTLFYLLLAPTLLYYEGAVFVKEIILNTVLSAALFTLIRFIYEQKGRSSI